MRMGPGLGMEADDIGPGLGEILQILIHRRDHQMHVERLGRMGAQRLHHGGPDGDIGHEMPVHHVDMNPIRARCVDRADFIAKAREIGGEDRGGDQGRGDGGSIGHEGFFPDP